MLVPTLLVALFLLGHTVQAATPLSAFFTAPIRSLRALKSKSPSPTSPPTAQPTAGTVHCSTLGTPCPTTQPTEASTVPLPADTPPQASLKVKTKPSQQPTTAPTAQTTLLPGPPKHKPPPKPPAPAPAPATDDEAAHQPLPPPPPVPTPPSDDDPASVATTNATSTTYTAAPTTSGTGSGTSASSSQGGAGFPWFDAASKYTVVGLLVVVPTLALTALLLATVRTRRGRPLRSTPLAFSANADGGNGIDEDDSEDGGDGTERLAPQEPPVVSPYGAVTRVRFPKWTRGGAGGLGIAVGWAAKPMPAAAVDAPTTPGDEEEGSGGRRSSTATLTDASPSLLAAATTRDGRPMSHPRSRSVSELQPSPTNSTSSSTASDTALALNAAPADADGPQTPTPAQEEAGWQVPVLSRLARWLGRPARAQAVATAEEPARRGGVVLPSLSGPEAEEDEEVAPLRRGSSPPALASTSAAAIAVNETRGGRAGSVDSSRSARSARSGPTATTVTATATTTATPTTVSITPDDTSFLSLAGWRAQRLTMAPSPTLLQAASANPTPMNSPVDQAAVAVAPPPPSPMVLRPL